ncbi:MAG TPA: DUF4145 domain-containing protein [Candidatus Angelobacter sp.]|nr:DUF4145 domain-containing protein [Candidatus Angelobacter sp.]
MTDRSQLLRKVLETWDASMEGERYLEWLIKPEALELDGGDLLREAVLDVMEDDDQLKKLEDTRAAASMQEFYQSVPLEIAELLRPQTAGLLESLSQLKENFRSRAAHLRNIRHLLNNDRVETLAFAAKAESLAGAENSTTYEKIAAFHKDFALAEQLAAQVTALSRTSVAKVKASGNWKSVSTAEFWDDLVQDLATKPGEDWFDYNREKLDRYYSQQLVSQLENIVERALTLRPVGLEVNDPIISSLFQEAHEAFLYGFDSASIALCRSLIDHSLKDKLSHRSQRSNLQSMIEQAAKQGLLDPFCSDCAQKVRDAGNNIMHDMSNLRRTAQEVLDCTRSVLKKLYDNMTSVHP